MKTTLKTLGIGLLLLGAGVVSADTVNVSASAQVNVGGTTQKPQGQEIKDEIHDLRAVASTTKAEMVELKTEVKGNIQTRAQNRYTKMLARFQATITRETEIMAKINSRIGKMKANGSNTTEAEGLTADAKVHLDAATADLTILTNLANTEAGIEASGTTSAALRAGLASMRQEGAQIEVELRAAHNDLIKAVVSLLKVVNGANVHATTSAQVNANEQ